MSVSYGNTHSSALYVSSHPAIDADSSSDDDETFTLEEAILIWYEKKTRATRFAYNQYVQHFRNWLNAAYGRDICLKLKQNHVKLYLIEKAKTTMQMRPVISVLKSLFKHLKKLGVIKRDILLNFDNCKQKPPRHERKLDVSTVKLMFKESLKQSTPVTHTILQLLVYAGLRRTVLSKLLRTDIVRTELIKDGDIEFK